MAFSRPQLRWVHELEPLLEPALDAETRDRERDAPVEVELHLDDSVGFPAISTFNDFFENFVCYVFDVVR